MGEKIDLICRCSLSETHGCFTLMRFSIDLGTVRFTQRIRLPLARSAVSAVTAWKRIAGSLLFKLSLHYCKSATYIVNTQEKKTFPAVKNHCCNIRRKCFSSCVLFLWTSSLPFCACYGSQHCRCKWFALSASTIDAQHCRCKVLYM